MKINIGIDIAPLNGYINIDPVGGDGKTVTDFKNLDGICSDSECVELLAPDILDYVHNSQLGEMLKNWVKKIRHGGKIIVGGSDLIETSKQIFCMRLNTLQANQQLFGTRDNIWKNKYGQYTMLDVVEILSQLGLQISRKRVNGTKFIVEAQRA